MLSLFTATAIEHEPDNRFLEVALAVQADYLITVNTARGHFDRKNYEYVRVVTPGEFLKPARFNRCWLEFSNGFYLRFPIPHKLSAARIELGFVRELFPQFFLRVG